MSAIIHYVLDKGSFSPREVANFLDDVYVSKPLLVPKVISTFSRYALPTKPPEALSGGARVLGLEVKPSSKDPHVLVWSRRSDISLDMPVTLTKRSIFSWTGQLVSHYPVCGWLRIYCSYLKRLVCDLAGEPNAPWDRPLPPVIRRCCRDIATRLEVDDPVFGLWMPSDDAESRLYEVYCDASVISIATSLICSDHCLEDQVWLIAKGKAPHINISELTSIIRGINLAISWNVTNFVLYTDSKAACSWVDSILHGDRWPKLSGLYATVVRRRLVLIQDLVSSFNLTVTLKWCPSGRNYADALTRVPAYWTTLASSSTPASSRVEEEGEEVVLSSQSSVSRKLASASRGSSSSSSTPIDVPSSRGVVPSMDTTSPAGSSALVAAVRPSPLPPVVITVGGQEADEQVARVREVVRDYPSDNPHARTAGVKLLPSNYRKVYAQLRLRASDDLLCRVLTVPGETLWVPICPRVHQEAFILWAHEVIAHGNWSKTWTMLRRVVYFPDMAQACQRFVGLCSQCVLSGKVQQVVPTVTGAPTEIPNGPWDTIYIDTLTIRNVDFLIVIDGFSRFVEATCLDRKDGEHVARALALYFYRWGPPRIVRSDNGPELVNFRTLRLYNDFGVVLRRGSARHPQSQSIVERVNRSILIMLRKTLSAAGDLSRDDLQMFMAQVLYSYHVRPHQAFGDSVSPFMAMVGWEPRAMRPPDSAHVHWDLLSWSERQGRQRAWLNDYLDTVLTSTASQPVGKSPPTVPFRPGMKVMVRRGDRSDKLLPRYEAGYVVCKVLSPTLVQVSRVTNPNRLLNLHSSLVVPMPEEVLADTQSRVSSDVGADIDELELLPADADDQPADDDGPGHEDLALPPTPEHDDDRSDAIAEVMSNPSSHQDSNGSSAASYATPVTSSSTTSSSSSSDDVALRGYGGGHVLRPRGVLRAPDRYDAHQEEEV
ncbi:hypothetical protein FOZ63_026322 [Perkinsus olseni]|uniref:Integrase catalytic domain-containing protein n=1 Tax=Perkinsus olseni TaxID=32597 RepID=A0A7J6RCA3_PEROL|nr:hypothetical protein FOZ63_026322 [Perkinsus olseni]